jgi:hypothetical protein
MPNWSKDLVLNALQDLPDPVGSLVRAFPGRANVSDSDWLDDWFIALTRAFSKGAAPDAKAIVASGAKPGELSLLARTPVQEPVRLVSIWPRFFRGFRALASPIPLDSALIVIEGRNSSGKTSLSEAIEWVLTGELSRRTSGQYGHPTELADCITNQFRPPGEETSVTLVLRVRDASLELKRVLRRDYSATASDEPESDLFVNGTLSSAARENDLRAELFAGVHPILMQHNLRKFVHDDPTSRRQYFERLLQIDELTALIEKAVIGPTRLAQLAAVRALIIEVEKNPTMKAVLSALKKIDRLQPSSVPQQLETVLITAAKASLPNDLQGLKGIATYRDAMEQAQKASREARLPMLGTLARISSQALPDPHSVQTDLLALKEAANMLSRATEAASALTAAQKEVARALERMVAITLVDKDSSASQQCPLCQADPPTLGAARVKELMSWSPLSSALDHASEEVKQLRDRSTLSISRLRSTVQSFAPALPSTGEVEQQLRASSDQVRTLAQASLKAAEEVIGPAASVMKALDSLTQAVRKPLPEPTVLEAAFGDVLRNTELLVHGVDGFRDSVARLEEAVGAASFDDTTYRLRERWLDVASLTIGVAEDVAWEHSKTSAKDALDGLRDAFIALRAKIIEDARRTFSSEMTAVWHLLRSDSGAAFSRILVPAPRGRGYKLEFELKATISDGTSSPEVDALRVFSESQINVIGIAAYVTRARLLGHKLLIFDDPVQSMDEEHFRSFSANLLTRLLDEGLQVLVLTHSDTFARRLNDHHYIRDSYVTLETRTDPKLGCHLMEGNRRISERLTNARRAAKEGDLSNAWRFIRLAIERLYTLAYASQNPNFDPDTWKDLTGESMWNQGAGQVIEKAVPGSTRRFKEILAATVAGAHDKAAGSETDLVEAAKYIGSILAPLRLSGG